MKRRNNKRHISLSRAKSNAVFLMAMVAMAFIIYALDFISSGSLLQDYAFIIGTIGLLFAALFNRQKNLIAMEITVIVGILLSIFSRSIFMTAAIIATAVILLVVYLSLIGYYKQENIGVIGSVGFALLAVGYALNTGNIRLLMDIAFALGSIVIVIYSSLSLFLYKVRIQIPWIILNVAFAIGPLIYIVSH